jgi:hypothetical protein
LKSLSSPMNGRGNNTCCNSLASKCPNIHMLQHNNPRGVGFPWH